MQTRHLFAVAASIAAGFLLGPVGGAAGQGAPAADIPLDSLLNTRISAASKYAQTAEQAPASVTILTSEDLRNGSFRDLQDALESVRGFYLTDDKNYPYLGTRGFSRPSDYNNRILVLVDGHTLNEQVWGGAPVGTDLPISLQGIERIEIVRGPGSTVYGTSAMFGVINIVTRRGQDIDGVVVTGRVASGALRQAELTAGHAIGGLGSIAFTGIASAAEGSRYTYPEYPGIQSAPDGETRAGAVASLMWGDASARAGFRARTKSIPTGAYDTDPSDPRNKTFDENIWAEVGKQSQISARLRVSTRLFADHQQYHGAYATDAGAPYRDRGTSTSVGSEAVFVLEPLSSYRVTGGVELRRVFRAQYAEGPSDGIETSDDAPYSMAGVFLENELQLHRELTVVAGARLDGRQRFDAAVTPRVAVIARPRQGTTLKLLYGRAFRAPSAAEAELTTNYYKANPDLAPERIQTIELELRERIGTAALVEASVYHYRLTDLISPIGIGGDTIRFGNMDASRGTGAEVQADFHFAEPFSGRVGYAYQQAEDAHTGSPMSNSPAHIATASIVVRAPTKWRSSVMLRQESGRATLSGPWTSSFTRADFHLSYTTEGGGPTLGVRGARISLAIANIFDADYSTPAGLEHRQNSIRQTGRATSLQLDWRF